jgi:hypothetical protein
MMETTTGDSELDSFLSDLKNAIVIQMEGVIGQLREGAIRDVLREMGDDALHELFFSEVKDPSLHAHVAFEYARRFYMLDVCKAQMELVLRKYVESSIENVVTTIEDVLHEVGDPGITAKGLLVGDLITRGWVRAKSPSPPAHEAAKPGQISEARWPWPLTETQPGAKKWNGLYIDKEMSGLRICGYRVGKTNGMLQAERRRFLGYFFENKLPSKVVDLCGDEYGQPKSSQRLRKMAAVIAANCRNFKRNDPERYMEAIEDWESDLEYLRSTYYRNSGFEWPATDV